MKKDMEAIQHQAARVLRRAAREFVNFRASNRASRPSGIAGFVAGVVTDIGILGAASYASKTLTGTLPMDAAVPVTVSGNTPKASEVKTPAAKKEDEDTKVIDAEWKVI